MDDSRTRNRPPAAANAARHPSDHTHHHGVFCTIVPPHVLDRLARADDPALHEPARGTLERDALQRTRRRITTVRGIRATAADREATDQPRRTIYDAGNREELPGKKVRGEGEDPGQDASINRAYAGLGATFDLFLKVYGRRSIDGGGLPLDATVHYGQDYGNAFWDGERMVFGDGDGEVLRDFTLPLDVTGHELTHGVTQYTANRSTSASRARSTSRSPTSSAR